MKRFETNMKQNETVECCLKYNHIFKCHQCNIQLNSRTTLWRHKQSCMKQNETVVKQNETTPYNRRFECELCHIHLNSRTTLWRHKKTCNVVEDICTNTSSQSNDMKYKLLTDTILELVKKNEALTSSIVDMSKTIGSNNNINSNNKFNLNVFLNEKCKNAMSLTDFVSSINLTIEDFIQTGERGFVDGISNIIVERINNMDLHDRPLHCTDLKRETVYIKDTDKWEKDEDKDKLRKAVKGVAYKNERMRPIWYEETPDVDILGSENCEKFFKYSESALGGCGKEQTKAFEDKVIRNILKEVTIDKEK